VSWINAQEFIRRLNEREDGYHYRLPTEAEWEYASRAGDIEEVLIPEVAWYEENCGGQPHEVGTKKPNAWGLYDMHGNVWEWCEDWYSANSHQGDPITDPKGPSSGEEKVLRGGAWTSYAFACGSTFRHGLSPHKRIESSGFRLVASVRH
jgi:formylglycine-generating enzyme required for sulfatase activity